MSTPPMMIMLEGSASSISPDLPQEPEEADASDHGGDTNQNPDVERQLGFALARQHEGLECLAVRDMPVPGKRV